MTTETIFTNARIVLPDAVVLGTITVRDGRIADVGEGISQLAAAQDLAGDYLTPGLIELHTDNLERHFIPRPGVVWPSPLAAILAHDAQIVAAGITTVLDAICVGEYRDSGTRRFILDQSVTAVKKAGQDGLLRTDHHLHLRCEVTDPHVVELFDAYVDEPLVRLVSLMDHTPGQRQWHDLSKYRQYYRKENWSEAEFAAHVEEYRDLQARYAAEHRFAILERCRGRALALASHDDTSEAHVEEAAADGIHVSEFPTSLEAARHARKVGLKVLMGSPNLVRGQSHSGNVAATELATAGLLDGLSSDYVPASLVHGAFLLYQTLQMPLPEALALITAKPAEMVGLNDRGRIAPGLRADLLRVHEIDGFPVVRSVWRGGCRVV